MGNDDETQCPICLDTIVQAYVVRCGHTYCYQCISRYLLQQPVQLCPTCQHEVSMEEMFPNFLLDRMIGKGKQESKGIQIEGMDVTEIDSTLEALATKRKELSNDEKEVSVELFHRFLTQTRDDKLNMQENLQKELNLLELDLKEVEGRRESKPNVKRIKGLSIDGLDRRLEGHMADLQSEYFQDNKYYERRLAASTKYTQFKTLATFEDNFMNTIVSSIEFDKDDEFFATAGVTRKIKLFEFESVVKGGKYPVLEVSTPSKISCLSFNLYMKTTLLSSDYEGIVALWDAKVGTCVLQLDEHEKRAWSVDFSNLNPTQMASGGDDLKVKLWSINQRFSTGTIYSKANVCSVKFHPSNSYQLCFGSADHHIHYYDLRNTKEPLKIFEGHQKAVSYVKFLDQDLVTASTDGSLKVWDIKNGKCKRSYRGHENDKNFIGLAVNGDFLVCGSESNSIFAYNRHLSTPVASHRFGNNIDLITGLEMTEVDPSHFVSSVCFKRKKSDTLVTANSQGRIKVVQLC